MNLNEAFVREMPAYLKYLVRSPETHLDRIR